MNSMTERPNKLAQLAGLTAKQVAGADRRNCPPDAVAREVVSSVFRQDWEPISPFWNDVGNGDPVLAVFDDGSVIIGLWGGADPELVTCRISGADLLGSNCVQLFAISPATPKHDQTQREQSE